MGRETKIEWCDHTFNPWRGCSEESEGCRNCYARQWARRNPGQFGVWGENGYRAFGLTKAWKEPLRWNRQAEKDGVRRRVFCGSMMDLFERLPREHPQALELVEARVRLFNLAQDCSHLDWLFLTKRQ